MRLRSLDGRTLIDRIRETLPEPEEALAVIALAALWGFLCFLAGALS